MVFPRVLWALDDRQHRDQGGMFSFTVRWWTWQSSKGVLTFPLSTWEIRDPFRHICSGNHFLANLLHIWVLLQNCSEICGSRYLQVALCQIPHGLFFLSTSVRWWTGQNSGIATRLSQLSTLLGQRRMCGTHRARTVAKSNFPYFELAGTDQLQEEEELFWTKTSLICFGSGDNQNILFNFWPQSKGEEPARF